MIWEKQRFESDGLKSALSRECYKRNAICRGQKWEKDLQTVLMAATLSISKRELKKNIFKDMLVASK